METIRLSERNAPPWILARIAEGKVIHNAPRPILGEPAPGTYAGVSGALDRVPGCHGIFFAALDPSDPYFARFSEQNERLDARKIVLVSDADLEAEFRAICAENDFDFGEVVEMSGDVDWRKAARMNGIPA